MLPLRDNVPTRSTPYVTVGLIVACFLVWFWWFLLAWIVPQVWSGGLSFLQPQSGGGVAFFAHIGGFAFGAATILLVAKKRPEEPASNYPVY